MKLQQQMFQAHAQFEADRQARTAVVSAAVLLKNFQANAAAEARYRGKDLEVSGTVERSEPRDGESFVVLHAGDSTAAVTVECFYHGLPTTGLPSPASR